MKKFTEFLSEGRRVLPSYLKGNPRQKRKWIEQNPVYSKEALVKKLGHDDISHHVNSAEDKEIFGTTHRYADNRTGELFGTTEKSLKEESISESEVETVKMGPYGEGIPAGHIYNTAFGSKVDATGYAKYAISKGSKAVIGVRDGMHHVHHTKYADLNEWRKSDHFKNYFASLKK